MTATTIAIILKKLSNKNQQIYSLYNCK